MTISFWVSAAHAGSVATYTYAPFFSAYAKAPGTKNEFPMLILQSRGPVQINNNGWCDFSGDNHIDSKVNIYNQNNNTACFHFYRHQVGIVLNQKIYFKSRVIGFVIIDWRYILGFHLL